MAPVGPFILAEYAINSRIVLDATDLQARLRSAASSIPADDKRCMLCWFYEADSSPHDFVQCLGKRSPAFYDQWTAFRKPIRFPKSVGFCYFCGFRDKGVACGRLTDGECRHKDILKPLAFAISRAAPEHQQRLCKAVGGTWSGPESFLNMFWQQHANGELYMACMFLWIHETRLAKATRERENAVASGSGIGALGLERAAN